MKKRVALLTFVALTAGLFNSALVALGLRVVTMCQSGRLSGLRLYVFLTAEAFLLLAVIITLGGAR